VAHIAGELNRGGIPSSKGRSWTAGMVSHVLRNEAYAGNVVYRVHGGELRSRLRSLEGSSSDRIIRCEGAHEAIIGSEMWRSAQERLRANSRRQTDADLLNALNTARTRWHVSQPKHREVVTASNLREGYGRPDAECMGKEAPRALEALRNALRSGSAVDKLEDGWLIDHLLHVGFKVSFPRARFGGLHWRFQFTGDEREDVILGLGFSPPPCVRHVETYFFRATRWRQSEARPPVAASAARGQYRRIDTVEDLMRALNHAIRFRCKRAEELFRNAVRREPKLTLAKVADRLGWPVAATRKVYRTLELRGEKLPPLSNGTPGVKVRMTCPHCLRVRSLAPKIAVSLETEVCFECLHRAPVRTPNKLIAICPKCGSRRLLYPSEVAARSAGLDTQCRACSLADGRRKGVEAWRARKGQSR
jgi:hypothetical protein